MNQTIYFILILFSKIPLRILYGLRPLLFLILYRIAAYRKEVVYENIKNSFPEKSDAEIKAISKEFYYNFADYFIESIWMISADKEEVKKRFVIENIEIANNCVQRKKNIAFLAGHIFNFELAIGYSKDFIQDSIYLVYKKSRSDFWNQKLKEQRSRFGGKAIESDQIMQIAEKSPRDGKSAFVLVADQSPKDGKSDLFIDFLNQSTLAFKGFEKIVTRNNLIPLYVDIRKAKDGKYYVKLLEIKPETDAFEENELIIKFFALLEKTIQNNPSNWLWSHKRWKIKPEDKV